MVRLFEISSIEWNGISHFDSEIPEISCPIRHFISVRRQRNEMPNRPVPAILYGHRQMSQPIRMGDFYHVTFQNGGQQRCL